MADEDRGPDGPSLELPSLSFGRRRRQKAAEPPPEPEPVAAAAVPAPAAPTPEPEPSPPPLFVDEVVAAAAPPAPVRVPPAPVPVTLERKPREPRRRPGFTLPALAGSVAAAVTGVVVGVIAVGLTWTALRGCEAVRGASSCGDPGYLLLLGILVAMVVLGIVLLRAWGVPEPGSTSLLAVGLLAVLAMLLLVGVLFQWWMILVVPLCAALTFAAAHKVTTTYTEPGDR